MAPRISSDGRYVGYPIALASGGIRRWNHRSSSMWYRVAERERALAEERCRLTSL